MKADQLRHKSDLGLRGLAIIAKNEIIAFFRSKGLIISQFLQPILYVVFIIIGLNSSIKNIQFNDIKTSYAEVMQWSSSFILYFRDEYLFYIRVDSSRNYYIYNYVSV
ncbi:TPA: hypothetical protein ACJ0SD_001729 [Streptococcus pneumoniae]